MNVKAKIKHNNDQALVQRTAELFGGVTIEGEHAVVIFNAAHDLSEEQLTHLDDHEHELQLVRPEKH